MKQGGVGQFFEWGSDLGEYTDIVFVRRYLNPEQEGRPYEFHILKHSEYDGIGAFTHLMELDGIDAGEQPTMKDPQRPSLRQTLKGIRLYKEIARPTGLAWKNHRNCMGRPDGFAIFTFSQAQTQALYEAFERARLSSTAAFISGLDQVAAPALLAEPCIRKWLTSVNMRGGVTQQKAYGNCSSSILMKVGEGSSARDIHDMMRAHLQAQLHWIIWGGTNLLARLLNEEKLKRLAEKHSDPAIGRFGILSNMGTWPPPSVDLSPAHQDRYVWSPVAPASRLFPLVSTTMVWEGRLSFNLQLHPCLNRPVSETASLLQAWVEALTESMRAGVEAIDWSRQLCTITYEEVFDSQPILHAAPPPSPPLPRRRGLARWRATR